MVYARTSNSRGFAARAGELSEAGYIRAIAFFTLLMGAWVTVGARVSYDWPMNWFLLIATFVVSIVGIFMFKLSSNPVVSFVGVSIMSTALGLMIGPLTALYTGPSVLQAVVITAVTMGVMSVIGIMIPATFRGWGPYLMGGLTLLIMAQFGQILFMALGFSGAGHMPIINWFGIVLFVGFVAYDWSQALDQEHTWDNAIDASGGLILDAVNLFIRYLDRD